MKKTGREQQPQATHAKNLRSPKKIIAVFALILVLCLPLIGILTAKPSACGNKPGSKPSASSAAPQSEVAKRPKIILKRQFYRAEKEQAHFFQSQTDSPHYVIRYILNIFYSILLLGLLPPVLYSIGIQEQK